MGAIEDLVIQVTTFDHRPVVGARVTATRGDETLASATTDTRGRTRLERHDAGELVIHVRAEGLAPDERTVAGVDPGHVEQFILGREGMPFYYRGRVRVPFEPIEDAVGILLDDADQDMADAVESRADGIARDAGGEVIRAHENFRRSGIAVVRSSADATNMERMIGDLGSAERVAQAGALVQLSDEHASFLTDTIIARFDKDVDDEDVAAVAARHGLAPAGRIGAVGNVHRLRFDGPATYAMLDISQALTEEPGVVYAEPDLIHTVEEDAVIPTDFLAPEQWDHPIIDTHGAWHALRGMNASITFGSPDVIIAVVDSGIDATHPEFAGNVSNGRSKLYEVFDFVNMVDNMNTLDGDHGTACASAAAALANNPSGIAGVGEGIAGVAGNCRLIGIRRGGPESRYAEMYLWAGGLDADSSDPRFPARINPGADVITNSFGASVGSPISGLMSDTFDALTDRGRGGRGTLLFFSAGNIDDDLDVTFHRPWGMYERCFCVAASTLANDGATEIKAGYSSFGSTVDFCAPSNDNDGAVHNPPAVFGAHAATIQATPGGAAIPGRPDNRTTLRALAAAGATTLRLQSAAGMAAGQALLVGAPGTAGTEARRITAVNAAANEVTVAPALMNAHPAGAAVASGPRAYQSTFGGTSYATPVCAGAGALVLSANPRLHWHEVRDLLRGTAVKIDPGTTDPIGRWRDKAGRVSSDPRYGGPEFSEHFGFGRIDVAAAVRAAPTRVLAAEGKVTFLRVHDLGTKFGPPADQLDVEVVVRLDAHPDRAFGMKLRDDAEEPANRAMLDVLRTAHKRDKKVRIDYLQAGVKHNSVLLRVAHIS